MIPNPRHHHWRLKLEISSEHGVHVVAVAGRIGHAAADSLRHGLDQLVADGARHIAVDLAGVDYIGSAGLVLLDAVARRINEANGQLRLCAISEQVRLVIELAGWNDRFSMSASRAEAIAQLVAGFSPDER